MDREYLIKANLMESHKQFMRLCNEGYISTSLEEAGDEEAPDNNTPQDDSQGMPPMDGQEPQGPNGGMPPADPNQPPMDGGNGDMPPMDDPNNGMPPAGAPADMPPMDGSGDNDEEEPEDVLDVDDLTDAQEKLNKKQNMLGQDLGQLDGRIESLLAAVENMKDIINHNNKEITGLRAELEKRVPTQKERLDMRSAKGYPYNISPEDYWKEKEKEGVYIASEQKPDYTITADKVNNYNDAEIEKSFDDDNQLRQTMKDIFRGF